MNRPITKLVKLMKRKKSPKTRAKFYKILLLLIELYAMFLLGMSYYLAYLDKNIVLESLSTTLVKVIIYPFIAFTINRTIENFAEHNKTSFHTPLEEDKADG